MALTSTQITCLTTPTLLVKADVDGCRVIVHKVQNHSIYLGGSNVTTGNGFLFDHDGTMDFSLPPLEELYACSASGTEIAYVLKVGQA